MTRSFVDRVRYPVDPWALVETRYPAEHPGTPETLFSVANGYLGLRGNHIEGRDAHEHGTFINGFHETWPIRHAEQAYGFAEVGQTIINVPDAKVIRVYVEDEPLTFEDAEIRHYSRRLDLRTGVLSREVRWATPSGKLVFVRDERLVSFTERHLAILNLEVVVENSDAPITISSQILNRQDGEDVYGGHAPKRMDGDGLFDPRQAERLAGRVLIPDEYWQNDDRTVLSYRAAHSGMTVAVACEHLVDSEVPVSVRKQVDPDFARTVFRVRARAGVPVRITKLLAYHTSRSAPPRELVDRAQRTLDRVLLQGAPDFFRQQREWLDDFWQRSDVQVKGRPDLQQAIRWSLFQVAQASARADGAGIAAKGVTGSGYSGHYFWDTEIYVLPFLTATSPRWARNALRQRLHMLPAARRRAMQLNEQGALFPWRTINGEEASAYYAAGTAQYHINADVAFALSRYVDGTGDEDFLHREAVDIAVETARLWISLGFWRDGDDGQSFHIHGVTGPDEYTAVVNDNLFTNAMARENLRFAARAVRSLNPTELVGLVDRVGLSSDEPGEWERTARAMSIPFSPHLRIHPQDAHFLEREVWDLQNTPPDKFPLLLHFHPLVIYRFQVLKQTDVVLAMYLQSDCFTAVEKRANFDYYDPLTTGDSTLSAVTQSIVAAEVGYQDLAQEYFLQSLFVDLGNLHANTKDGVHIASAGGVWQMLVNGFAGMREHGAQISFDPRLPQGWTELTFALRRRDSQLRVTLTQKSLTIRVESGPAITLCVRGDWYLVSAETDTVVPLAGQGPRLKDRPTQERFAATKREDGTLLSATVPETAAIPIITDAFFP